MQSDGDIGAAPTAPRAHSYMDAIIMTGWEERKDLFRYSLADTETKVIPGQWSFVAQLNEGRATKKRATEFRIDLVKQEVRRLVRSSLPPCHQHAPPPPPLPFGTRLL